MKPYGREKKIKGCGKWKVDYRIRRNGRKIGNWWEDMCNLVPRKTMKQNLFRELTTKKNKTDNHATN